MAKIKEEDLFDPLKEWLEKREYEVFTEVSPKFSPNRADIVARRRPAITIIEMKTSLTLELLDQAYHWKNFAHYIYVAIPKRTRSIPYLVSDFLRKNRIGLLEVNLKNKRVVKRISAKFNRPFHKNVDWNKELLPEHQTWVKGGNAGGGYVTPYKLTINHVKEMLKNRKHMTKYNKRLNPEGWCTIKEILDHCETHYASPKNSLANALLNYEYEWCESKKENGKLWLRYKDEV